MAEPTDYVHGHAPAVLSSHARRTAKGFTPYVLPYIKPNFSILDVGCGPGTISADFAAKVPRGKVTCFDASETALRSARETFERRDLDNVEFVAGDVEGRLPFEDGTFDLVHAHQVAIHLRDPEAAMREMKRVLREGGIMACKDMIVTSIVYHPAIPGMDAWERALVASMRAASADPDMGTRLKGLALRAGFEARKVKCSAAAWCFSEREEVRWWGGSVAERLADGSELRRRVAETGAMAAEEMDVGVAAWKEWAVREDAWFGVMNGEVICVK